MRDDILLNKAATIERCVMRAREEYYAGPSTFKANFTRQDAKDCDDSCSNVLPCLNMDCERYTNREAISATSRAPKPALMRCKWSYPRL